jgi:thiol-disulfide isomerase/thioredoxin
MREPALRLDFTLLALLALLACATASAAALDFKPYGRGVFAKLRETHAGRPFVAHFWSVTCPPCVAELPEWAKIVAQKQGLDVVFVNADQPGDQPRAAARLEKAGLAALIHYGFADDFADRLYFEVDPSWRGELPYTALVDAEGQLVTVTGALDDPLIVERLDKTGR